MTKGKLYGVSVGPGDPELLTLRAARVLEEADCIAAPDIGGSSRTALQIIERYVEGKFLVDCTTPMTRDRRRTREAYGAIACRLAGLLDEGKSVAFVTLGDASIYSTWSYVCECMEPLGYEIEVVPGVTSFCAAAAILREPLCERDEQLLVVPTAAGDLEAALDVPGTKVFMKSGKKLGDLRELLRRAGLASSSALVARCGLPGQEVVRNLDTANELPDYMSVVVTKGHPQAQSARLHAVCPELSDIEAEITAPDETVLAAARDKWNAVAKPIGSLGVLEDDIVRIAGLTGSPDVSIARRAVVVMCADNGVVAQGVSQCGSEVTRSVAQSLGKGVSSVCSMAAPMGIDVVPVDIGMNDPSEIVGVLGRSVRAGTGDISRGPAMTRRQALEAIRVGIGLAGELKSRGYELLASGEMGIGNTTTSSAMASVLLGMPAETVTGRGAGLSDEGLQVKVGVVKRAIEKNSPDASDPLDVLAKLGGLDIAGLTGLFIGGALHRIPVVIDGFISTLAAYVAYLLCPSSVVAMIASHVSSEPAAVRLMDRLGLAAPIRAGLRLGEGTGAVCLVPLLDMALALYNGTTFEASNIEAYDPAIEAD